MEGYVKQPQEYLALLWREKGLALAVVAVFAVAGAAVALSLRPVYRATATVLIESSEVPSEFVRSTVTSFADHRLQVIDQRVMTTRNLVAIMDRFDLYAEARRSEPLDDVVERFRDDIALRTVSARVADPQSGRPVSATIAFTVSYDSEQPHVAQQVAGELVSLYLSKNIEERREAASETTAFLGQEAARLAAQINQLESRLSDFKQQHAGRLPGQQDINQQSFERAEQELVRNDLRREVLRERAIILEAQLAEIELTAPRPGADGAEAAPESQLIALRTELARLQGAYGPEHPDVVRVSRQIAALEIAAGDADHLAVLRAELEATRSELTRLRQRYGARHPDVERAARSVAQLEADISTAAAAPAAGAGDVASSPASLHVQAQIKTVATELDALARERQTLIARIEDYRLRLMESPEVERAYQALIRDYENTQARYNDIKDKQIAAEMAESLESEQKAERFSLIEPPRLPTAPVRPDRRGIAGGALAIGVLAGLGLVLLRDAFDDRIHGARQLGWLAGAPPLVVVPYIHASQDRASAVREGLLWSMLIGVCASLGLIAVHTFLHPLDKVWLALLARLGLG